MATRSDFGQKLLNDLRMRKDRMAASQSTSNSSRMAKNAYVNSSQNYKGSRQTKSLESVGSRTVNSQRRSNHGSRSLTIEESSKQLVPYGGGRNVEPMGDLLRAFTFSIENRGKSTKFDSSSTKSIMGFLQRIGRRALDMGKTERRSSLPMNQHSSQFLDVSNFHINEISKGAQKLNQILRACSNGLTFDGYSIEIGSELLKGAMDLEESLRMLVNLQEASEYMVRPQRKNRIKLLEEEDDDNEESTPKIAEHKLVERPRFSFDKPSRNSHGSKRSITDDTKGSLMVLTYRTEAPSLSRKQASGTFNVVSHNPNRKPDNGRMSNVIAKLMGLDELPQSVNSNCALNQSSSTWKEGIDLKKNAQSSTKNISKKTGNAQSPSPHSEEKLKQPHKMALISNTQVTRNVNDEIKVPNGKSLWKDLEGEAAISSISSSRNDIHVMARRQDSEKHKEKIGIERGTRQALDDLKDEYMEARKYQQGRSRGKESTLHKEKGNAHRIHQQQALQKYEPREAKHYTREQQHLKQKFQATKEKGMMAKSKNQSKSMHDVTKLQNKEHLMKKAIPSKRSSRELIHERPIKVSPTSKNKEDLILEGGSMNLMANRKYPMFKHLGYSGTPKETGTKTESTKASNPPVKEDHMKVHRIAITRKIDEVITKGNVTHQSSARVLKHQDSTFLKKKERSLENDSSTSEAEQLSGNNHRVAEIQNVSPKKAEASTKMLNGDLLSDKEAKKDPTLSSSMDNERDIPSTTDLPTANGSSQDIAPELSMVATDGEDHAPIFNEDPKLKSQKTMSHQLNGSDEESFDFSSLQQHEEKEKPTLRKHEALTESETCLKQVLVRSRMFLNTAEALFKLDISIDIVHVTDHDQDNDYKVILDCAYEIMRRKGRRHELTLYPLMDISIISIEITAFDDLVKKIYKDIEKLKIYGGYDNEEYDDAKCLQRILERDVQNRDPDVNSMWDLGWNEMAFTFVEKDELIKDVERHLLNGLIDDIVKELLHSSVNT